MRTIVIVFLLSIPYLNCRSTDEDSPGIRSNQILSERKYTNPKFDRKVNKPLIEMYHIPSLESLNSIRKDPNNQIESHTNSNLIKNFNDNIHFLVIEKENPYKPELFEIRSIRLNDELGSLEFLANYDHLMRKSVKINSHLSGKIERNHHTDERLIPIKRNETTEGLYNVPRKISDDLELIRTKRHIYSFPIKVLSANTNQLLVEILDEKHTYQFDKFEDY